MAQNTIGLRRALSSGAVYQWFQKLLGAGPVYRTLVSEYLQLHAGESLLDIGCGPATILDEIPDGVDYHGFDESERYIARARARYAGRGTFWTERLDAATLSGLPRFDAVLASGVLHHLDDGEALALFSLAREALKPDGRLVTYDPCFVERQSFLSRYLVARDRGQNVRAPDGYAALARQRFSSVASMVLDGHLPIPYTAVVLTCRS